MKSSLKKLAIAAAGIAALSLLTDCASKEPSAHEAPPASTQSELAAEGLIAVTITFVRWTGSQPRAPIQPWKHFGAPGAAIPKTSLSDPAMFWRFRLPASKNWRIERFGWTGMVILICRSSGQHVGGLSESELNSTLVHKLGAYLYHPQAAIFVKSYNNRQVSVTGEVRTPADYTLNGPDDTVRELIQRAGGMTQQASPEIVLTAIRN